MNIDTAIGIAARIWCDQDYSHVEMNTELAEKIAHLLKDEADKQSAQQGIARELLPSDGFVDDFDHEQLGMLPKDAIPQSREF